MIVIVQGFSVIVEVVDIFFVSLSLLSTLGVPCCKELKILHASGSQKHVNVFERAV